MGILLGADLSPPINSWVSRGNTQDPSEHQSTSVWAAALTERLKVWSFEGLNLSGFELSSVFHSLLSYMICFTFLSCPIFKEEIRQATISAGWETEWIPAQNVHTGARDCVDGWATSPYYGFSSNVMASPVILPIISFGTESGLMYFGCVLNSLSL